MCLSVDFPWASWKTLVKGSKLGEAGKLTPQLHCLPPLLPGQAASAGLSPTLHELPPSVASLPRKGKILEKHAPDVNSNG